MGFLRRLLCRHEYEFERNIYGDEIVAAGYKRSWWVCPKCGRRKLSKRLYPEYEQETSESGARDGRMDRPRG